MVRRCYDRFTQPDMQQSGQVMVLKYEDLVRDPKTHGTAVLNHLSGTPTRAFERRLGDARTGSVGKHKKRVASEIRAAEAVAGAELALYGYDGNPALTGAQRGQLDQQVRSTHLQATSPALHDDRCG